jgi:hypothetical protein
MNFRPDPKPKPRIKPKKVNNPHKLKGYNCSVCGDRFQKKMSDTITKWCSEDCKEEYDSVSLELGLKNSEETKKETTLSEWKERLQNVINEIVKIKDKDFPCIVTGEHEGEMHAGHFFSVGAHPELRFNVWNIHKQCFNSNVIEGGEPTAYAYGFLDRYGSEQLGIVNRFTIKYKTLRITKLEIKLEFLPNARMVLKELKAGADLTRDQINEMIGIYR